LLLDDKKEEREGRSERERERERRRRRRRKGQDGRGEQTCNSGEEINARNRRDQRQEIEEKI